MNRPSDIDELIQQRLYNAEVQAPDFVWPNVEKALRKRRKRFVIWFFLMAGLGISAVFLGITKWNTASNISPIQELKTVKSLPEATPNLAVQPRTGVTDTDPASVTDDAGPDGKATIASSLPTPTDRPQNRTYPKGGLNQEKQVKAATLLQGTTAPAQETKITTEMAAPVAGLVPIPDEAKGQLADAVTQPTNMAFRPLGLLLEPISLLTFKPKNQGPNLVKAPKIARFRKGAKNCYDFAKNPSAWLLDVYAGPSFVEKEMSVNNPENSSYLKRRRDTERRDWAYNAGVRGTFVFDRYFMLRTGLHYEQMTEVFEYIDPAYIKYSTDIILNPITGDTLEKRVTIDYGAKKNLVYNRFGMLDIPLMVGMEWRKGRSGFNINAGVSFNILFWKRGAILSSTNGLPRYFTPGNAYAEPVFKNRTGLSAMGSIQWFYHLQPRLRIFAEPYFRQIVQPLNISQHPVNQRYGIGGIRVGVTKILH